MSFRCRQVEALEVYLPRVSVGGLRALLHGRSAGVRDRFELRLRLSETFGSGVRKVRVSFRSARA